MLVLRCAYASSIRKCMRGNVGGTNVSNVNYCKKSETNPFLAYVTRIREFVLYFLRLFSQSMVFLHEW